MASLRTLWRKMKKEKKRLFWSSSPAIHLVQYDIDSYSQNFDDGYSSDPDNACRSFSVRFAILSSKVSFDKGCEVTSDDDNTSEMSS
ncbi:uncharacterized protein LOC129294962 [Prosopis cineraria]|uniref:uncharacterized protein LOC129294962 n=1 Tax=Prosopis cineraria TaxID=364024 RepID=UPI00240F1BAC|nr:uncharacterized protein LOC129294962 [Prosopis cineraria]